MASHPFSHKHTKAFIILIALGIVGIGAYLEFLFGLAGFVGTIKFPLVLYFPFVFPLLLLLTALFSGVEQGIWVPPNKVPILRWPKYAP